MMFFKEIRINEDFIRLDSALKFAGFTETGGHSKIIIQNGEVKVNGEVCTMRVKKLRIGDTAEFDGQALKIIK